MKRYLITGGSGFIGSAISHYLVESGNLVRVLDDNTRGRLSRLTDIEGEIDFRVGDIRNEKLVHECLKDVDSVVHLAYINGTANFYSRPEDVLDVAIRGMQNIVTGLRKNTVSEFYLASSSEVYQNPEIFPTPESVPLVVPDPFNPRYSYGLGKILQEFMTIHELPGIRKKVIFRPHNIYGPDMGNLHVVPELFSKISNPKSGLVLLKGDGSQRRSMCEIDDFIKGFAIITSDIEIPELINIGTGFETTILDLALEIARQLGVKKEFQGSEAPSGETDRRIPDINRLEQLGFKPTVTIEAGIAKYYKWFKSLDAASATM
jgi:nucleoside-diphosphate-sugar epimerase